MWIVLIHCLSSQESEDSISPCKNGCGHSFIVSTIDIAKVCFCPECQKEHCPRDQYSQIFETSEERNLEAVSTSLSAASHEHAKISAVRELESAWKESEVDFSLNSSDSLAIFDPDSFSWKMCQLSLFEDLSGFCWSSLRWGMIRDGRLYQPPQLEPAISEKDGFCLPTPTATEGGVNKSDHVNAKVRPQLATVARSLPTPMARDWKGAGGVNRNSVDLPRTMGGSLNPQFVEELMGYQIEWTALEPWVIPFYRSKPEKPLNAL